MMKKNRFKVMGILLLFCLLLSGCNGNWKDYFYTEESLKQEAQRALEEKYDEEFVILNVWVVAQTAFGATCSPKNDRDVVFDVELYKDGSGMYRDEYVQGVVDKQIQEKLQKDLQVFFGECFVQANVFYAETEFDNVSLVTMEDYARAVPNGECFVYVIIDESEISPNTIQSEYEYFSKTLLKEIEEKKIPELTIHLYIVDNELMKWCKDYFKVNTEETWKFTKAVDDFHNFGFGYLDGKFNKTLEEYTKLRMEEVNK